MPCLGVPAPGRHRLALAEPTGEKCKSPVLLGHHDFGSVCWLKKGLPESSDRPFPVCVVIFLDDRRFLGSAAFFAASIAASLSMMTLTISLTISLTVSLAMLPVALTISHPITLTVSAMLS